MNEEDVAKYLKNKLLFSQRSIEKLKKFKIRLLERNRRYNLISKSTINSIWNRHILDSAQIIKFLPDNTKQIADLGTGAGFPGIILSIFDEKNKFHVKLYEKSPVKRQFLNEIKELLGLEFDIESNVYQKKIVADVVLARAFKKLAEIIKISRETCSKNHKLIILKGKNAQSEINNVSLGRNYSYKLFNSITDNDSKIILVDAKKNDNENNDRSN